jgi:hypothetical protein
MERTRDEQIAVANEIIRQLGGSRFRVLTGAKDMFAHADGVSFKIPGNMTKDHINYVRVVLDPSDTYTVKFGRICGRTFGYVSEHSMVYNDGLQQLFTAQTGLETQLLED